MKKIKKRKFNPEYVKDLCVQSYTEDLESQPGGKGARERVTTNLAKYVKDGNGEEAYVEAALAPYKYVAISLLSILEKRKELPKEAIEGNPKGDKELLKRVGIDSSYLRQVCIEMALRLHPDVLKKHVEEKGKEKGEERFENWAQRYSPRVRFLLQTMSTWGQLPKKAKKI